MRKVILFYLSGLAILTTSCTRVFYVVADAGLSGTVLSFYDSERSGKKKIEPCVWAIDVINDISGKSVFRLAAENRCSNFSSISIGKPYKDFLITGSVHDLKAGNVYHAEVSADEGVGKSAPWTQR